jgi:hypothetical protein
MNHRKGKIRAAALRGLSRAKHPKLIELSNAALGDKTTTVVREAIAILHQEPGAFNKDLLLAARVKALNARVELLLIRSAQSLDKWDVLETYLTWYMEFDPMRYHVLDVELENWRRSTSRRFSKLGEASKARITEKLTTLSATRPMKMWEDITHALAHA